MSDFLNQIIALPTLVYTSLLFIVILYWVFVIIGALDIDMFDGAGDGVAEGLLDGAGEGAADALGHAAEGIGHAAEGVGHAAEGIGQGAEGLGADGVDSLGHGTEGIAHGLDLASLIGLRKAPFTVIISMLMLISWVACFLGMQFLAPVLDTFLPHFVSAAIIGLGSLGLAMPVTGISASPLAPLFETHKAGRREDLVGKTCRIETGSVDRTFGQATVEEDGGWMKVEVRTRKSGGISRGDEVLIVAYDPQHETFTVEALTHAPPPQAAKPRKRRGRRDKAT